MLIIVFGVVIILLVMCIICLIHGKSKVQQKLDDNQYTYLVSKNKLSMVEYHMREFKEGGNPFTTLRSISDILKMEDKEVVGYEEQD